MKKFGLKTIVISVIAMYVFTISFSLIRSNVTDLPKENTNLNTSYIEPTNEDVTPTELEYFAAALHKIFSTIAGVGKVVKGF